MCTFEKGYIDQPVYSCRTCAEILGHPVGVCYGCYLECHLGHDKVVELFTKRKFRCDCPTLSGTTCECSLYQGDVSPPPTNPLNKYSPNFDDIFCWCGRSYSADSNAVMIQCFVCEDWFHSNCITEDNSFKYPLTESDDVFVCKDCLEQHPLLKHYGHLQTPLDATTEPISASANLPSKFESETTATQAPHQSSPTENVDGSCLLSSEPSGSKLITTHALFAPGWTSKLCRCKSCVEAFAREGIAYLLEEKPNDTEEEDAELDVTTVDGSEITLAEAVRNAEKKRKREPAPVEMDVLSASVEAFQALPAHHEAKSTVLHAYDSFSKELETFFKKASDEGRVITAKDIYTFFAGLKGPIK